MNIVYPNQKIITVHKAPANGTNYYGIMNKQVAQKAGRELSHNELRVYLCLTLNQSHYQMALSTSYIAQNYGGSIDGLQKAIKGLIQKGYLVKEKGNYYHFYDDPQMVNQIGDYSDHNDFLIELENSQGENTVTSYDKTSESSVEIIKEDYIENIKEYKNDLSDSFSDDWDFVFEKIQVERYAHTMKQLKEAVGYEPDVLVIKRIVDEHWLSFEKKLDQQGGYRFRILLNLVEQEYPKWKAVIASEEEKQQKRVRVDETLVDFGNAHRTNRRRSLAELEETLFCECSQQVDVVDMDLF